MAWVWSDELLVALDQDGTDPPHALDRLRRAIVAFAVPEGEDPVAWILARLEDRVLGGGSADD